MADSRPAGSMLALSGSTPLRFSGSERLNALTIDLEDWRQLIHWRLTGETIAPDRAVLSETDFLLDAFAEHGVSATFFVLDNIVGAFPDLVRRIHDAGHEIASHGLSHARVYTQSREEFAAETSRARASLEDLIGTAVTGYRAAEFSITENSVWALEVLAEMGFAYDSSIYPIRGRRLGIPSFPLEPQRIAFDGGSIVEFPLTAVRRRGRNLPVAGGGYFRVLPYRVTSSAMREVNAERRPALVYVHPYEFARDTLSVPTAGVSMRRKALYLRYAGVHNFARASLRKRLSRLLEDFSFVPLKELLNHVHADR